MKNTTKDFFGECFHKENQDELQTEVEICDLGDATIETKGFDFEGAMDRVSDRRT